MPPLRLISVALCAALLLVSPLAAHAAGQPTLSISPKRVAIGHTVVLKGTHFPAKRFVTFLIAVPNAQHPEKHGQAFVQKVIRTQPNGTFDVKAILPVIPRCGKATIYALPAKTKLSVGARMTLIGCKANGRVKAPPPPPSGHKKHKKKP